MDLLKDKILLFDRLLLNNDWGTFSKEIRSFEYRNKVYSLLNKLSNIVGEKKLIIILEQDVRKFITSYTMIKFELLNKISTKDINLYYVILDMHKKFDDIFYNKVEDKYIFDFFKIYNDFLKAFKEWKEYDQKQLLDKTCTQQYKQIKVMEKTFKGDTPDEKQLSSSSRKLRQKIEKRIKQIGGDNALQYVNTSPQLKPLDALSLDMEEHMKKAYWDMFEDEVSKNNFEPICKNLDEFRKYLFSLLGKTVRANTIREEFDNNVDLKIIKQMIRNGNITSPEIYNIVKLLTKYVQQYIQSISEDKDTQMILDNVYKKINEKKDSLAIILRYYFQSIFEKLDKTKVQIALLKI